MPTDAPTPPPPDPAAARRAELIDRAIPLFARDGYAGVEVESIAAAAGCAKGTIYRYFESKQDLFRACVDHVMAGLIDATTSPEDLDPIDRIASGVRGYLAYFRANPAYIELLIQERAAFRDRERPTYYDYRAARRANSVPMIRGLIEEGRVRPMDPERAIGIIGDLLYGTIFTAYFAGRAAALDEQADLILEVLFKGLLTPGEAAARERHE